MYSDVYTHTFAYVDLYMYTWRRIRSMLNAYIYYKRVHAFSHFPSRLSSPQKLDRVLLSYGFNSYRLRVNKLELELERGHACAYTINACMYSLRRMRSTMSVTMAPWHTRIRIRQGIHARVDGTRVYLAEEAEHNDGTLAYAYTRTPRYTCTR